MNSRYVKKRKGDYEEAAPEPWDESDDEKVGIEVGVRVVPKCITRRRPSIFPTQKWSGKLYKNTRNENAFRKFNTWFREQSEDPFKMINRSVTNHKQWFPNTSGKLVRCGNSDEVLRKNKYRSEMFPCANFSSRSNQDQDADDASLLTDNNWTTESNLNWLSPENKHYRNISVQGDWISSKEVVMTGRHKKGNNQKEESNPNIEYLKQCCHRSLNDGETEFNTPWFNDTSGQKNVKKKLQMTENQLPIKLSTRSNRSLVYGKTKRK